MTRHSHEDALEELVGFANVTDWDGIRSALAKRGHGVGAMHHLPEFTDEEVRD